MLFSSSLQKNLIYYIKTHEILLQNNPVQINEIFVLHFGIFPKFFLWLRKNIEESMASSLSNPMRAILQLNITFSCQTLVNFIHKITIKISPSGIFLYQNPSKHSFNTEKEYAFYEQFSLFSLKNISKKKTVDIIL